MTDRQICTRTPAPAVQRLEMIVGRWRWSGSSKDGGFEVDGWAQFKWLPGKHFLEERFELRSAGTETSGIAIIGADGSGDSCIARYFDNNGQYATYRIDVSDHMVNIAWDNYRCVLRANADGTMSGPWEASPDGKNWSYWYDATLTRLTETLQA